ncbi:MAG: PIN domain-containing protein [Saprospiraceae bacterium]|nr:PIN domain-containing protein [Saprospiraceae bacterium]
MDLTNNIVEASIEIRKSTKTKLPDAIIAATAIAYDLVLISRDTVSIRRTPYCQPFGIGGTLQKNKVRCDTTKNK